MTKATKTKPKKTEDKKLILRCSRTLRDRLAAQAAQNVLDGVSKKLGPGSFSANAVITEIFAKELGLDYQKDPTFENRTTGRIGISIRLPSDIFAALTKRAENDGISINEEMHRILEREMT